MISKNLAQRIIIAAVAIPIIIFLVFSGGDAFLAFILLLAAIGIIEYLLQGGLRPQSPFFIIPFIGVVGTVWLTGIGRGAYGSLSLLGVFLLIG